MKIRFIFFFTVIYNFAQCGRCEIVDPWWSTAVDEALNSNNYQRFEQNLSSQAYPSLGQVESFLQRAIAAGTLPALDYINTHPLMRLAMNPQANDYQHMLLRLRDYALKLHNSTFAGAINLLIQPDGADTLRVAPPPFAWPMDLGVLADIPRGSF